MPDPSPLQTNPVFARIHALLGSVVIAIGFWLMWGELPAVVPAVLAVVVAAFLITIGRTIARVWAWATMLLGVESLGWPILTMIRVRMETGEPTEQQMGQILTAILFGLFSAIFWTSFSYGIFNWARRQEAGPEPAVDDAARHPSAGHGKKKRKPS